MRRRVLAGVIGLALLLPGVWVEVAGQQAAWWAEGAALVAVATGAALLWTAVTGVRPDWIDG